MADVELMEIINQVKSGELSVEEACRRLELLEAGRGTPTGEPEPPSILYPPDQAAGAEAADSPSSLPDLGWWQHAWLVPLGIGIGLVILSAWLLSWGYMNERFFWFYCSWLPLTLGMLVLMLGVWSRQARWAHVRIRSSDGTRIAVSTPLPVKFASWLLQFLIPRIPALEEKHLDTLPLILDALGTSDEPIFVDVDDEDGDQVRVYIL